MRTLKRTQENYKKFGAILYENAHHPCFTSRSGEYEAVKKVAAMHHGFEIDECDFDNIIAEHFNDGVEFDWPHP